MSFVGSKSPNEERPRVATAPLDLRYARSDYMVSSENIYALVACRNSVYTKWGKRAFDLSLALMGMLLLSPVFMVCSFAVVCSSPGPILFRQRRVGRFGTPIQVLKFRTMFHQPGGNGKRLTVGGDSRITQVGSISDVLSWMNFPTDKRNQGRHEFGGSASGSSGIRCEVHG